MANISKWTSRLARLRSMNSREVFDRLTQSMTSRVDWLRYRMGYDFARAIEFGDCTRQGQFFFQPAEVPSLCALLRQQFPSQAKEIVVRAEKICRHQFDLLGYEDLDLGREIDWHLDIVHDKRSPRAPWFKVKYLDFEQVGDSKITWELNRHQHFVTLAKAYCLTGDDKFAAEILTQWSCWQKENPYPIGINWASSLEVALRSLSWIWTFFLLRDCPLYTADWRLRWQQALGVNARHVSNHLSTYFSPNTHLLGEAEALFFLGVSFPGLNGAKKWRDLGWKILVDGARTQVREDGFYFEQSTYYHIYALDLFLHARILAGIDGREVAPEFDHTIKRMLNALLLFGRAGAVPSIGDDDGGRLFDAHRNRREHLLDPLSIGAVLYRRGDFKFVASSATEETLWLLGSKGLCEFEKLASVKPSADSAAMESSGYYMMVDSDPPQQLVIDAGPLGSGNGGHGHADALSICLIRDGRNLLIDPGAFEYVGPSGERARLRGTSAHNTMQVDGVDPAEATGPFAWKDLYRAKVARWIVGRDFDLFTGSHDGYNRLPLPVTHRRWVFHRRNAFWFVLDRAEGSGAHRLNIAWHLDGSLDPVAAKKHVFADGRYSLVLLTAEGHGWKENVRRDNWSPVYGKLDSASTVNFETEVELPADFATLLMAGVSVEEDLGKLVRFNLDRNSTTSSFRYTEGAREHHFVFSHQPAQWSCGPWTSDADFLYWSSDGDKEEYNLILCNGSCVDAGGRRVLSCERRIGYAEVSSSAGKVEVGSSDPQSVVLQSSLEYFFGVEDTIVQGSGPKGMGV